jgi:hypothetical protein
VKSKRRQQSERMASDDVPIAAIVIVLGIAACSKGHWGLGVPFAIFGALWLVARIYHLTHKDEVFGDLDDPK